MGSGVVKRRFPTKKVLSSKRDEPMTNANDFILIISNISKIFPGVNALENVDFSMKRGEIHALVGENGAGKSTLIKELTSIEYPDADTITENIMLGHEPHRIVVLRDRKKTAEYSGDESDQTIIQTMAGDL
jgi:ABC-type glutathione transport system ATPase component